jgi:hypothetical protein
VARWRKGEATRTANSSSPKIAVVNAMIQGSSGGFEK